MTDYRSVLERAASNAPSHDLELERILRRRDRKRRNQRITAGVVGIGVFVAAVASVTTFGLSEGDQRGVSGGVGTGPAVTPPTEAIGPIPEVDYLLDLNTGAMTPLPESIVGSSRCTALLISGRCQNEYAASPDGSMLAYRAPVDGKRRIFLANLDGTGIEQLAPDLVAASWPAWSPDGSKIAYVGHRGDDPDNLFVLDVAAGTSTQLTFATSEDLDPAAPDVGPWMASSPSFTPDGASIVYNVSRHDADSGEREVRIVPIAGGKSVGLISGSDFDADAIGDARLSPDGSLLLYGCNGYSALCVANADGSDGRELVQSADAIGGTSWSPDGTRISYSTFHAQDVFILDVATGQATYVAEGMDPTWLDDHTLIVEINKCYDATIGAWNPQLGCGA